MQKRNPQKRKNNLSFISHLEELRQRILFILISFFTISIILFLLFNEIHLFSLFTRPLDSIHQKLYFYNLMEPFLVRVKISFILALIINFPIIIYQVLRFVLPALKAHEKKVLYLLLGTIICLFFSGVFFTYQVILPLSIKFMMQFVPRDIKPMLRLKEYVSLFLNFSITGGLIFLLPVLILFLIRIRLVTYHYLIKHIPEALLIILILAAILTPPDIISQILLAVPMFILYLISVLTAYFLRPKETKII